MSVVKIVSHFSVHLMLLLQIWLLIIKLALLILKIK